MYDATHPELALCPNTPELHIYHKTAGQWKLVHVLAEVGVAMETGRLWTAY